MKIKSLKILKNVSIGIISSFVFLTFIYINASATGVNIKSEHVWNEDKQYKSEKYFNTLTEVRNKNLREELDIDNVENYINDMKSLYDLSLTKNKVDEVEKIMSDYEKNKIYVELLLLTGDKKLAEQFLNDKELYFKFERVV